MVERSKKRITTIDNTDLDIFNIENEENIVKLNKYHQSLDQGLKMDANTNKGQSIVVDDFEKFCTSFNKIVSTKDTKLTVARNDREIFKKPQRKKRVTTSLTETLYGQDLKTLKTTANQIVTSCIVEEDVSSSSKNNNLSSTCIKDKRSSDANASSLTTITITKNLNKKMPRKVFVGCRKNKVTYNSETLSNSRNLRKSITIPVNAKYRSVIIRRKKNSKQINISTRKCTTNTNSDSGTVDNSSSSGNNTSSCSSNDGNSNNNNNNNSSSNNNTSPSNQDNRNNDNSPGNRRDCHTTNTFCLDKNEEFEFVKPLECPVFNPTEEEFENPFIYINKIRQIAEKYGICKIKPPKTWTPPFTVDVNKFRFTPRVQCLNELEARTRVKLNYLDQIAKFWELHGSSLKIPMVERKTLDLYSLHRLVQEEGGMNVVTKERKWSKIAQRMGYPVGKSVGTILKGHYERILYPFNIFKLGISVDSKLQTAVDDQDYKPHRIVSRQRIAPPNQTTARRSKRFMHKDSSWCLESCMKDEEGIKHEIDEKHLQATEMCVAEHSIARCSSRSDRLRMANSVVNSTYNSKVKKINLLATYICHICNRGGSEEYVLLCSGCGNSYHTFCLIPQLNDSSKSDWKCPMCAVEEFSNPQEAFGFEQASREYTLQQFGEMADHFKANYFNMPAHLVSTDLVEREFWRIVSSVDEDVTVEYGADLHTMDHGSGFPTKNSAHSLAGDLKYAESNWNLNNIPLLEESVLGHINADISGMKVPWMYVGMCFATFCWHNEDHWNYSINYLHWGEPKTWYGVPGKDAEAFENTMKSAAPELFQLQPDLLQHLVTLMNPNILMQAGVPIYRTDQHAGEFIITFPRAYHAGFSQGYNFAEAVNFAPADWLKFGRECISHYSKLRRCCVFSHDELVCKIALDPERVSLSIASSCYADMAEMVDSERKLRNALWSWGVTQFEREPFELRPDDERQCDSCKTTCFLSAVSCTCTQAIVCLQHFKELCKCPPAQHTFKYRYSLIELPLIMKKLKVKTETYGNWLHRVRDVLSSNRRKIATLEELQQLIREAEKKKFSSSVLLQRLNSAVFDAEKCVTIIQQMDINKMRTRTRNANESTKYKLTLNELTLFVQEIDNLCCTIPEGQSVRELLALGINFVQSAEKNLLKPLNKIDEKAIEHLIEEGSSLCIELHEIKALKYCLQQVNWYNRVKQFRDSNEKKTTAEIQALIKEGINITPDTILEKQLVFLQNIISMVDDWELVAAKCFQNGTQYELSEIELLLERAEEIQGVLPSQPALKDALKKAKEWLESVEALQANETYPYFHTVENVVNRGKNIPFQLEELKKIEEHLISGRLWKERASRTFLKKDTTFTLMDVLSPRSEAVMTGSKTKKKSLEEQFTEDMGPTQMVNAFKNAEEKELKEMRELRKSNMEKNPQEDKYCTCKRKFQGHMFHCQLCKDWFHEACVPSSKNSFRSRPSSTSPSGVSFNSQLNAQTRESKYLCQLCMRSRRPRLESILPLLVSLQHVPIRLPEGEALQCLTERSMNWQERARQLFTSEDVASALAALSIISQKIGDNYGSRSEKTITESRRKTKIIRKRRPTETQAQSSDDGPATSSEDEDFRSLNIDEDDESREESSPSLPTKIEHAYSVPPPCSTGGMSSSFGKLSSGFGSPLHKSDMPGIQLSKATRETLEELMMEGDLLEVSLGETEDIWRILNAARPSVSDLAYIQYRYNVENASSDAVIRKLKKRKSDDNSGPQAVKRAKVLPISTEVGVKKKQGGVKRTQKFKRRRKMKLVTKDTVNSGGRGGVETKKRKRGKRIEQEQMVASTSDEDEECSASTCARPSGREVDWVQCDGGCDKWFHMFCVGLDKKSIRLDDDYICKICEKHIPDDGPPEPLISSPMLETTLITTSMTTTSSTLVARTISTLETITSTPVTIITKSPPVTITKSTAVTITASTPVTTITFTPVTTTTTTTSPPVTTTTTSTPETTSISTTPSTPATTIATSTATSEQSTPTSQQSTERNITNVSSPTCPTSTRNSTTLQLTVNVLNIDSTTVAAV